MSYLARILVYPIKSLDGVSVTKATILKSGALQYDREFAICDAQGRFVNAKRNPKVHLLRTSFDIDTDTEKITRVCLEVQGREQTHIFHIDRERTELEAWLSNYFNFPVKLCQNIVSGFPDDTNASGPTVISTATLETVASWFPPLTADEMRRRLRANLEIEGVPAFWEDRLFAAEGDVVPFLVRDVQINGVNPCQRCVVPTRDSLIGEVYPNFQKLFVQARKETLPSWVDSSRFNHFYRLSVNTRIPESEAGNILQVGDEVEIQTVKN
ncbi:MOSC N-terminal beta barrel domain-containing protein [Trichocoleus sp. DQ-A3]|uniref:MOSC N-terminal beta barrel domain-containing protein n=1 Tax=Cyanophyceae TaxID=3028117 RepID=UPI0016864D61|nr:MOSC N-terminal beta barrel domain-containing protein [Coleofasciculus sp. FACHB-125]